MIAEVQTPSYHQQIEEHFLKLRGQGSQLSPLDYPLIQEWYSTGVPLELVKRVMERGFQSNPKIGSLKYFRNAVEEEARRTAELQAGGRPTLTVVPSPAHESDPQTEYNRQVADHLQRCLNQIEQQWPNLNDEQKLAFEAVGWQILCAIDSVPKSEPFDGESLEAQLDLMEDQLHQAARATLGEALYNQIQQRADDGLKRHKPRMPAELYADTLNRAVKKAVFAHFGLPRLSLFFMEKGR